MKVPRCVDVRKKEKGESELKKKKRGEGRVAEPCFTN